MYQRIMDDVIDNCQTTFEEDGVNQDTLDELRTVGLPFSLHSSRSILLPQVSIITPGSSPYMTSAFSITPFRDSGPLNDIFGSETG